MKKLFLSLTAILCSLPITAQTAEFSVRAGINLITHTAPHGKIDLKPGMNAGILSDININDLLFIQPGLVYSFRRSRFSDMYGKHFESYRGMRADVKFQYLEVPLSLGFRIRTGNNSAVMLNTGPYFSYAFYRSFAYILSWYNPTTPTRDQAWLWDDPGTPSDVSRPYYGKHHLKKWDIGWNFGAVFRYARFYGGVQYGLGMYRLCNYEWWVNDNPMKLYTGSLSINLGCYLWKTGKKHK